MSLKPSRDHSARPHVFVGSSTEGLRIADNLQVLLDYECEVEIWNQGAFEPGGTTLASLVREARTFDFAVLVVTPDDTTETRGETRNVTRDNVLFELGLFMGALGNERVYMLYDRLNKPDLPSDLAGVTAITYALHKNGNLRASLGAAATQLKEVFRRLGLREPEVTEVELSQLPQNSRSTTVVRREEPPSVAKTASKAMAPTRIPMKPVKAPPFDFEFKGSRNQLKMRRAVVDVYAQGRSIKEIAKMAQTPQSAILKILNDSGVELRGENE